MTLPALAVALPDTDPAKDIADRALTLSPEKRSHFISECAGDDAALLERVQNLITDTSTLIFKDLRDSTTPRLVQSSSTDKPVERLEAGFQIGDFQILRVLGSGSFAT